MGFARETTNRWGGRDTIADTPNGSLTETGRLERGDRQVSEDADLLGHVMWANIGWDVGTAAWRERSRSNDASEGRVGVVWAVQRGHVRVVWATLGSAGGHCLRTLSWVGPGERCVVW